MPEGVQGGTLSQDDRGWWTMEGMRKGHEGGPDHWDWSVSWDDRGEFGGALTSPIYVKQEGVSGKASPPLMHERASKANWFERQQMKDMLAQHSAAATPESRGKSRAKILAATGLRPEALAKKMGKASPPLKKKRKYQGDAFITNEAQVEEADTKADYEMTGPVAKKMKKKKAKGKCPPMKLGEVLAGIEVHAAIQGTLYDTASLEEKKLTMADRKALPKSSFVFPERAPAIGSYPIHDAAHARAALHYAKGKKDWARVRATVLARYPGLAKTKLAAA